MSYEDAIREAPWSHDFFAVLRAFERRNPDKPMIGDAGTRSMEYISLGQEPYLEFPASTINAADNDPQGRLRLFVRFLGLLGPQGALPMPTTEEAYAWMLEREHAFARFLDIFNHRFLQFFYRAWADSRPVVHADRPRDARFHGWIGAVAGIGTPAFENADGLALNAKLAFVGLVGARVPSASRLEALIRGLFGVRTEVEEFVGGWLPLERSERSSLGGINARLGQDLVVGSAVFGVDHRFRLRLSLETLESHADFLPNGRFARDLVDAVFLMVGDEYDWDVELALPAREVRPIALGASGRLGWTTWMVDPNARDSEGWRSDSRFNLSERLRAERRGKSI